MPEPTVPVNLDAEESILGAAMISGSAAEALAEALEPRDFYRDSHGEVARSIAELVAAGEPVDAISVSAQLERTGRLEAAGGSQRIHELASLVPAAANARHYAGLVRDAAQWRDQITAGQEIARAAYERLGTPTEALERAEQTVFALSQRSRGTAEFVGASEAAREAFERLRVLAQSGREIVGLPWGFQPLDRITSGMHPGNLILLAARPSLGKSSLSFSIIAHLTLREDPPVEVGLFTLEMNRTEVMNRLYGAEALVDSSKIQSPTRLGPDDWERVVKTASRLSAAPLHIDDSGISTFQEIRSKARRLKLRHPGVSLLIIDYVQLLTSGVRAENRTNELSQISRGLKMLARELDLPILVLSQLSREVERRHDKRPMLSDLRECLPVDEWVATPSGPARIGDGPGSVVTVDFYGARPARAEYIPKKHNSVYLVRTQYGTFRATARHLVLTGTGYKQVNELCPGRDVVASPKAIGHARRGALRRGRLLGWLIGNGGLSGTPSLIYRRELDPHVRAAVAEFGVEVRPRRTQKSPNVIDAYLSQGIETGSLPNPLMQWIRELGLEGKTAHDKQIPAEYLGSSDSTHADILLGLWETDGTVTGGAAKYATVSEILARQTAWLLLTRGIRSTVAKYDYIWEVRVSTADNDRMARLLHGSPGGRFGDLSKPSAKYLDSAPAALVELAADMFPHARRWQKRSDGSFKLVPKAELQEIALAHPRELASILESPFLKMRGVGWGIVYEVRKLEGATRVADLHVPGTHNFVTNGIVVHNSGSLEQDADVVLLLYRDDYYNPEDAEQDGTAGVAEVNVAKQRNGPTGMRKLAFQSRYARFTDLAD